MGKNYLNIQKRLIIRSTMTIILLSHALYAQPYLMNCVLISASASYSSLTARSSSVMSSLFLLSAISFFRSDHLIVCVWNFVYWLTDKLEEGQLL